MIYWSDQACYIPECSIEMHVCQVSSRYIAFNLRGWIALKWRMDDQTDRQRDMASWNPK